MNIDILSRAAVIPRYDARDVHHSVNRYQYHHQTPRDDYLSIARQCAIHTTSLNTITCAARRYRLSRAKYHLCPSIDYMRRRAGSACAARVISIPLARTFHILRFFFT